MRGIDTKNKCREKRPFPQKRSLSLKGVICSRKERNILRKKNNLFENKNNFIKREKGYILIREASFRQKSNLPKIIIAYHEKVNLCEKKKISPRREVSVPEEKHHLENKLIFRRRGIISHQERHLSEKKLFPRGEESFHKERDFTIGEGISL